jgi:hypothetical protein
MFAKEEKENEEIMNYFLSFHFSAVNKIFKRIILI